MFDKLFEILFRIWKELLPFYIVKEYQLACILRLGKFYKVAGIGFHFKIPFVDETSIGYVKTRTEHLPSQTLTTSDNKQVVLKTIIRFCVFDIKKYTIDVWSPGDVLKDTVQGIVGTIVQNNTWEYISKGIEEEILTNTIPIVDKFGITVEKITFSDFAAVRTLRLINN